MDKPILMKLYTVVVYDLMMCMKVNNLGPNNFKGDNYVCGTGVIFAIPLMVLVILVKLAELYVLKSCYADSYNMYPHSW